MLRKSLCRSSAAVGASALSWGNFFAQGRLQVGDERGRLFIKRDLRIDRQPHLSVAAHQLIVRQREKGGRVYRPSVVGCEIAAESETAEQARTRQRIAIACQVHPGEELARVIGDLVEASRAPSRQLDRCTDAGKSKRALFAFPVEARLTLSRGQKSSEAQSATRHAAAQQPAVSLAQGRNARFCGSHESALILYALEQQRQQGAHDLVLARLARVNPLNDHAVDRAHPGV